MFNLFRKKRSRPVLAADQTSTVGTATTLFTQSHTSTYAAVFEDDGETGYLYGLDRSLEDQPILDALHIYNVSQVADRAIPSRFQIIWSADGFKVALFINGYPHAAFDFLNRRGYCRTNFPPADPRFTQHDHAWSDDVLKYFQ